MDTIVIFDGVTGEHICDATFGKFTFTCDLTQVHTSTVTIAENAKVKPGDIWYIPSDYPMSGIIASIDTNTTIEEELQQELSLYMGGDVYPNDVLMIDNTLIPNITETNEQPYLVEVLGTEPVTGTDNLLGLDVLIRQMMRQKPCRREMTSTGCGIFTLEALAEKIEFRLDDPLISVNNLFFADDQYNALRLYNMDDLTQSETFYINRAGDVSLARDETLVQRLKSMKVEADKWNDLSYATSLLRTQSYNNEIEFSIPLVNDIGIKLDSTLLGKEVRVHIEGYIPFDSIISKYVIIDNNTINLTLGLARSRMSDYINREV